MCIMKAEMLWTLVETENYPGMMGKGAMPEKPS